MRNLLFLPPRLLVALALATTPLPAGASIGCAGTSEERQQLEVEKAQIGRTISDLAMGGSVGKRPKLKGEQVGQAVLGTATSVLLPFGVGAALNLGMSAVRASGRKKAVAPRPAAPDAEALIVREAEIDRRLTEIASECGAAPAR